MSISKLDTRCSRLALRLRRAGYAKVASQVRDLGNATPPTIRYRGEVFTFAVRGNQLICLLEGRPIATEDSVRKLAPTGEDHVPVGAKVLLFARVSQDTAKELKRAAEDANIRPSDYIRGILTAAAVLHAQRREAHRSTIAAVGDPGRTPTAMELLQRDPRLLTDSASALAREYGCSTQRIYQARKRVREQTESAS